MPTSTWERLDPQRRERVLRAAMQEFGRHGYSTGSLNVIAREAGVAKGSLFQYFADKFDFFSYTAERTSLAIQAELRGWLTGPGAGQSFSDFLFAAVRAWIDYFEAHPLERAVMAASNLELDPVVRQAVRAPVHQIYVESLRPILRSAVADGALAANADIDALLCLLLLLLPHLALAPFEPALDPAIPLYGKRGADLDDVVRRLLGATLAAFVNPAVTTPWRP
ncbi:MAG TPA: TetR/AcrR family transcriptional regulator [Pseudonocardiaceae bacterium]|nr:TetR/AcrR family transcriptional regulator [Pseudonocardiaceae bacterium]